MIHITQFHCPLGTLFAAAEQSGLLRLDFVDDQPDTNGMLNLAEEASPGSEFSLERNAILNYLGKELSGYFLGKRRHFETPINLQGTTFQRQVWEVLKTIPYGTTISYGELAVMVGRTSSGQSRAVANANARNPIAILVPCHRVVGMDGSLTGYAGGIWRKQALLVLEGARLL